MATKPAVSPVKGTDIPDLLRSLNNALSLIREQIFQVQLLAENAQKQAGQNTYNASQGSGSVSQLQQQLAALQSALAELQSGSLAPTATYRADQVVASLDPVFPTSAGGVTPIDTQDPTQIFACIGIAISNAAIGANVTVRRSGVQVGAGVGFERGRAVYAQIGGGLTQVPNYAAVALPIGVAINDTDIEVRAAWPSVHEKPIYGGGFEDFMPVTLALVRATLELVDSLAGQPDGFVVKVGGVMTTRVLIAGSGAGIVIDNEDGAAGDPTFRLG